MVLHRSKSVRLRKKKDGKQEFLAKRRSGDFSPGYANLSQAAAQRNRESCMEEVLKQKTHRYQWEDGEMFQSRGFVNTFRGPDYEMSTDQSEEMLDFKVNLLSNRKPNACQIQGFLWIQRDKLFSRWKDRFVVLTKEEILCFKNVMECKIHVL